ncbi:transcription factor PIF1-like, partial [Trifolium medium]|nr:transcription factor PIF1-like [Trifolium medium]
MNEDPPFNRQDFSTESLFHPSAGEKNGGAVIQATVREPECHRQTRPASAAASRPPIHPMRKPEQTVNRKHNFAHFTNHGNVRNEPGASSSSIIAAGRESTVVDSCDTPIVTAKTYAASRLSETIRSTAETGFVS